MVQMTQLGISMRNVPVSEGNANISEGKSLAIGGSKEEK